jgi:hypothetical protein
MRQAIRILLPGVALFVGFGCSSGPEPPPFHPVVDTKLLMQAVIDPNADVIWDAVKTIDTPAGTEEVRPKNEEQWVAVRNSAVAVAEAGNLLMLVPRAKDGNEWMKRAQEMIDTGERAIKAAEAKNAPQLFTVGGDIYDACSNCHRQYMDAIVNANK